MAVTLFVAAHPDDETLMCGVALAEHVAAGHQVHVLVLTRGFTSVVRAALNGGTANAWWAVVHDPAAEGYAPLDEAAFGQARMDEFATAVDCLASGLGTITVHEGGLLEGFTAAQAQTVIQQTADAINPGLPVWIKTHSHVVDDHPDHLAAGAAARTLALADPVRFGNLRHYVLPPYWADARLSQVTEAWDLPNNAGIAARAVNACRSYGAWAPDVGRYAIGWHSVRDMFTQMVATPKNMYHP